MEYLCYITPPTDLCNAMASFAESMKDKADAIPVPKMHCTLFHTYMREADEKDAVISLGGIDGRVVSCETGNLSLFDNDRLVLKLNNETGIRKLHLMTLKAIERYVDRQNIPPIRPAYKDDAVRMVCHARYGSCYVNSFYNPHISVGKVKDKPGIEYLLGMFEGYFIGFRWDADSFSLAKKETGGWQEVKRFALL